MGDSTAPIGVFDSGVGGTSVLGRLYKIMPDENYIYYGDGKNAPYGVKSTEQIRALTVQAFERLYNMGAKAVVLACNTATSAAAAYLREKYPDFPIIGLEPALKPAVLNRYMPTVVVMATELTLREEKFRLLLSRFEGEANVIKLPAPGIVELVEAGKAGTRQMRDYLKGIFKDIDLQKVDSVVLGCTHFPFALEDIRAVVGEKDFYDGGEGAARNTKYVLLSRHMRCSSGGKIVFENSDPSAVELSKALFEKARLL